MSGREIEAGDLVVIAVTVERVPNPNVRVSRTSRRWVTWETHLCLERVILLRSAREGPATIIEFPDDAW